MVKKDFQEISIPPLMPSVNWMSEFLYSLKEGLTIETSIKRANHLIESPKEFSRFVITDPKGQLLTLSVAVEGGGRKLREIEGIERLKLSDHGNWRHGHLGALEACMGRKPYFTHIFPHIAGIYNDKGKGSPAIFNMAILKLILSFLINGIDIEDLKEYERREAVKQRGKEIASEIVKENSSIEVLMQYGKESLLGFIALKEI